MVNSVISLGRNDPCYCGSGKKYKKCHLNADQRVRVEPRQSPVDPGSTSAPGAIKDLPKLLRRLSEQGSASDRKKFGELLSEIEPVLEYVERRPEIEAAAAALEAHRPAFEKLVADGDRCLALTRKLFAEECFASLRFTAADVQRAFDQVGYPGLALSLDKRSTERLHAAILYLADKDRRRLLATRLILLLPEFVSAGRYLEAWLVQSSAVSTTAEPEESNGFLFHMFAHGYDAWAADKRSRDAALFRQLGIDPARLPNMSIDEVDAWLESQKSDPAAKRALEAFFRENPHLREESTANLEAMERNSAKLLDLDESRFLHLPYQEVEPWLKRFNEHIDQQGFGSGVPDAAASEEAVGRRFEELLLPLLREMADSIFTRERIQRLVADLKQFRRQRFTAGDRAAAAHAMGAITYLEREDSPGQNSFLLTLCWMSLTSAISTIVTCPASDRASDQIPSGCHEEVSGSTN